MARIDVAASATTHTQATHGRFKNILKHIWRNADAIVANADNVLLPLHSRTASIAPRCAVYLAALVKRLEKTWDRRTVSAHMSVDSSGRQTERL
ncbi:MAG: hypothetical protein JWR21_2625 [Herminiimonas sp.]|nr:hypothetical protein [Herminiimonas sp.]